jgi:hypothetical protein
MEVGGQRHPLGHFTPGKDHCIGGWVGPRAGLDGCGENLDPTGIRRSVRYLPKHCGLRSFVKMSSDYLVCVTGVAVKHIQT